MAHKPAPEAPGWQLHRGAWYPAGLQPVERALADFAHDLWDEPGPAVRLEEVAVLDLPGGKLAISPEKLASLAEHNRVVGLLWQKRRKREGRLD